MAENESSSAMTMVVAILAIVVLVGLGIYAMRAFGTSGDADTTPSVNLDVDGVMDGGAR